MTKKVKVEIEISQELMQKIYSSGFDLHDGHQAFVETAIINFLDSLAPMLEQDLVDPFNDAILGSFSFDDVKF